MGKRVSVLMRGKISRHELESAVAQEHTSTDLEWLISLTLTLIWTLPSGGSPLNGGAPLYSL